MLDLMEQFKRVDITGAVMFGFLALASGVIGLLIFFDRQKKRQRQQVLHHGMSIIGWIVDAHPRLKQPGEEDYGADVLITFDSSVPDVPHFLADVATRLPKAGAGGSVGTDPQDLRHPLPPAITGGLVVYRCHVEVHRDCLPEKCLTLPFVQCKAVPGERGPVYVVPYASAAEGQGPA